MKMNSNQIKNMVEISKLIIDMDAKGAMEVEINTVAEYLDGVINDELEFNTINELRGLDDMINKYQNNFDKSRA